MHEGITYQRSQIEEIDLKVGALREGLQRCERSLIVQALLELHSASKEASQTGPPMQCRSTHLSFRNLV